MPEYSEIVGEALALPEQQRADLAMDLIRSLSPADSCDATKLKRTIDERQRRVREGNYHSYSAAETISRIQAALNNVHDS